MSNFRRRLMMSFEKKYTPVEYLESTGTQYIDTGVKLNNNSSVEITAKFLATAKGKSYYLFGSSIVNNRYMIAVGSTTNKYLVDLYSNRYRINSSVSAFDNEFHTHKVLNSEYYIDNVLQGTQTPLTFSNTENAYIFDVKNRPTDSSVGVQKWQIKKCKIYNSSTLVRDYIPVLDSSNRPCLYDKVEDKFYYNKGSGEFLYG